MTQLPQNQLMTYKVLVTVSVIVTMTRSVAPSNSLTSQVLEFGSEDEAEWAIWTLHNNNSNGRGHIGPKCGEQTSTSVMAQRLYKITKEQPWHPKK